MSNFVYHVVQRRVTCTSWSLCGRASLRPETLSRVCMYVCMYACMYVWFCMYMHVCVCIQTHTHTHIYMYTCICMYVYVYACMYCTLHATQKGTHHLPALSKSPFASQTWGSCGAKSNKSKSRATKNCVHKSCS